MQWRLVDKGASTRPTKGTYRDWKADLAKEAAFNCVYCCIHESKFGGQRNFHVEHYRPKSVFPQFENSYENLFYACAICNSFKGNDWPAEPVAGNLAVVAYPDPSRVDYGTLLEIQDQTGLVVSQFASGKYIVERLYLNRPQMITLRRFNLLFGEMTNVKNALKMLKEEGSIPDSKLGQVTDFLFKLTELWEQFSKVRPYSSSQVARAN